MGMNAESFTFQIGGKTATIDKKNFNKFFKKVLPKKEKPDDSRRLLKEPAIDEQQAINEEQQATIEEQQASIEEQQAINEQQHATNEQQQATNEQQQGQIEKQQEQ